MKQVGSALFDNILSHIPDHIHKDVRPHMGLLVDQNVGIRAEFHKGPERKLDKAAPILDGGIELAVGKCSRAAFPELDITVRIQLAAFKKAFCFCRPGIDIIPALENDRPESAFCKYIGRKEPAGSGTDDHRTRQSFFLPRLRLCRFILHCIFLRWNSIQHPFSRICRQRQRSSRILADITVSQTVDKCKLCLGARPHDRIVKADVRSIDIADVILFPGVNRSAHKTEFTDIFAAAAKQRSRMPLYDLLFFLPVRTDLKYGYFNLIDSDHLL